jgi:hypothetical protein
VGQVFGAEKTVRNTLWKPFHSSVKLPVLSRDIDLGSAVQGSFHLITPDFPTALVVLGTSKRAVPCFSFLCTKQWFRQYRSRGERMLIHNIRRRFHLKACNSDQALAPMPACKNALSSQQSMAESEVYFS